MAASKKDASVAGQSRQPISSFSRTVLPYIVAAVIASSVMAWYF